MSNDAPTLDALPDLLTVREYASWARRSLNGAYADIARGIVPVIRFGPAGRVLRIPKAHLQILCQAPSAKKISGDNPMPPPLGARRLE
jgi:hypothetical protein